jgi:hypothetical protein
MGIVNSIGSRLSVDIDCPVKWPGFGKNVFVCHKHGAIFPLYRLRGNDWSWVKKYHDEVKGKVHNGKHSNSRD